MSFAGVVRRISEVEWIFVAAGALFLAVGAFAGVEAVDFQRRAAVATGQVTEQNTNPKHPTIRFTTATGSTHEFTGSVMVSVRPGDVLEVLYEPDKPRSARVNTLGSLYGLSGIFGLLGLVFILLPVWNAWEA